MAKNIIFFSDGTGQAGGFRFDEARTKVYNMFRLFGLWCGLASELT